MDLIRSLKEAANHAEEQEDIRLYVHDTNDVDHHGNGEYTVKGVVYNYDTDEEVPAIIHFTYEPPEAGDRWYPGHEGSVEIFKVTKVDGTEFDIHSLESGSVEDVEHGLLHQGNQNRRNARRGIYR